MLIDTGPLVALFDPREALHTRSVDFLKKLSTPALTTVPVLTEAFHLLNPASRGSIALRGLLRAGGLSIWHPDPIAIGRMLEMMDQYLDHPMDLADASLVVAAEYLAIRKIFTFDRKHFAAYRFRRGHRLEAFVIVG
jgi:predicted nucleic acid-binding protein